MIPDKDDQATVLIPKPFQGGPVSVSLLISLCRSTFSTGPNNLEIPWALIFREYFN